MFLNLEYIFILNVDCILKLLLFILCYIIYGMSNNSFNVNFDDAIKKEARGLNNYDLGEVQEITPDCVVTERGLVDKTKFYIPKNLVESFDGHVLRFRVPEAEAAAFKRD
jgi:hypothetical protein